MNFKKILRKAIRENKESFHPTCASLYKICEIGNSLCYYDQICNRIFREENEELWDFIRLDINGDILLDDDAVFLLSDILKGYFDEDDIIDLWKLLRKENSFRRNEYAFDHIFDHITTKDLKKEIKKYECMEVTLEHEEAKQMVIEKAKNELKKRRGICSFVFKISRP